MNNRIHVRNNLFSACLVAGTTILSGCGFEVPIQPQPQQPPTQVLLTDVIEKDWDMGIREIGEHFPGGEFTEGDATIRTTSRYAFQADFVDVGLGGELSFHQAEWMPLDKYPYVTRTIFVDEASPSDYHQIQTFIEETYPKVLRTVNPSSMRYDDHYVLYKFDEVGNVNIGLRWENRLVEGLIVDVTHTWSRARQPSGER